MFIFIFNFFICKEKPEGLPSTKKVIMVLYEQQVRGKIV